MITIRIRRSMLTITTIIIVITIIVILIIVIIVIIIIIIITIMNSSYNNDNDNNTRLRTVSSVRFPRRGLPRKAAPPADRFPAVWRFQSLVNLRTALEACSPRVSRKAPTLPAAQGYPRPLSSQLKPQDSLKIHTTKSCLRRCGCSARQKTTGCPPMYAGACTASLHAENLQTKMC